MLKPTFSPICQRVGIINEQYLFGFVNDQNIGNETT